SIIQYTRMIQDVKFCIISYRNTINGPTELIILTNISPTNGMNTGSLNVIFSKIFIKINVPPSANAKATNIFFSALALVNISSDTSTPNLAESIVPAVVGDTN